MNWPDTGGPLSVRLLGSAILLAVFLGWRYRFRRWDQQDANERYEQFLRRGR